MLTELRIYHSVPGKLPDVIKRFREDTLRLFARHGIRYTAAWTTAIGLSNNDFTYTIEWSSLADREAKWAAFLSDPEWTEARSRTERNGPLLESITNSILQPVDLSIQGP
jgi:NIPSNAP